MNEYALIIDPGKRRDAAAKLVIKDTVEMVDGHKILKGADRAIHRYDVVVDGMANHAGTTPMDGRQDALIAASRLVLAVRQIAAERQGRQVGTVGRLEVEPNSPNVVPGRVTLSVEFRDLATMLSTELVVIDGSTTIASLENELRWSAAYHRLAARL